MNRSLVVHSEVPHDYAMKHTFDFDEIIDQSCSCAMKYEQLEALFGRRDLRPLWIADMDFPCHPAIRETMQRRFEHPIFGYTATPDSYWQAIIDWLRDRHGVGVRREELRFAPGVVKALAFCVNFFTREGDSIIIQEPVYHPFRMVVEGNGRKVANNRLLLTDDGDYVIDYEDLEAKMSQPQTTMMILCNPHNPAGVQWTAESLQRVARMAKKHGVTVVSDEIHGDLMLWGQKHQPFIESCPEAADVGIWLGAPSKTFNIPGFASSWIMIRNEALRAPFYAWLDANEFSDPTFTAVLAAETAYRQAGEWLDALIPYLQDNVIAVEQFMSERLPQVKVHRPQASFLVWLDMRGLGLTHSSVIDALVNKAHLALNSGTMFGADGEGFVRLNVATPRRCLMEALESMAEAFS